MGQIEQIRKEVERRMLENYNGPDEHENEIAQGVCASILTYIDSLPEEPSYFEKQEQKIKVMLNKLSDEEKALLLSMQGSSFGGFGFGSGLLSLALAMSDKKEKEKEEEQ